MDSLCLDQPAIVILRSEQFGRQLQEFSGVVAPEQPDRGWLLRVVHGRARVKPDASHLRAARG